jgi:hypothetical protein
MKNSLIITIAAGLAAAACISFEERSSTLAPGAALSGLAGSWGSSSVIPSPSSCADFKWNVTERTSTSAAGSFSATCAGDLKLEGTARGTLSGDAISWEASGTASTPIVSSCAIALTGTAELRVDEIRIPYSGQTCLGPVSGVQTLKRR